MAELNVGVAAYIVLHLLPVVLIVADLLAVRADRKQALKLPHARQSAFQIGDALSRAWEAARLLPGTRLLILEGGMDVAILSPPPEAKP